MKEDLRLYRDFYDKSLLEKLRLEELLREMDLRIKAGVQVDSNERATMISQVAALKLDMMNWEDRINREVLADTLECEIGSEEIDNREDTTRRYLVVPCGFGRAYVTNEIDIDDVYHSGMIIYDLVGLKTCYDGKTWETLTLSCK